MTNDDLQSWPYREARNVLDRLNEKGKTEGPVIFETGFAPSGLPHIGTFSEVARTSWVRRAFEQLSDLPTRLIAFSDNMDGLKKVPQNVPNSNMLEDYVGHPLCEIPDPFGEEESFSAYMNARFCEFLDSFGFDYEMVTSSECYRAGQFNDGLLRILKYHDRVRSVITPTLREDKQEDWSPFFPVCEGCGKINNTRVTGVYPDDGTVSYVCDQSFRGAAPCGHFGTIPVTDGHVKVGWKVDWALRWMDLDVDYEMYGKDLIESARISSALTRALQKTPPAGMSYEMFLDEDGSKISKSDGSGLSIDDWLEYGPLESLSYFIFQRPEKARKLSVNIVPQTIDRYLRERTKFGGVETQKSPLDSAIFFVDADKVDSGQRCGYDCEVAFSTLLNFVGVLNTDDRGVIWDYLRDHDETVEDNPELVGNLIKCALRYYCDHMESTKDFHLPDDEVMPAVDQFCEFLRHYDGNDAEEIQTAAYDAGNDNDVPLGDWFRAMYQLMLGQEQGPRLGTFVQLYGVDETLELIERRFDALELSDE